MYSSFGASKYNNCEYLESKDIDKLYFHILECIRTLSEIQSQRGRKYNENSLMASERRIFWQAIRKISDDEIVDEENTSKRSAVYCVLDAFPDNAVQFCSRSWMPLHWAVSLASIDIQDINTLINFNPKAVQIPLRQCRFHFQYRPIHLACMANNRVEVLHLLRDHCPLLGQSLAPYNDTPLHLAIKYSCSFAFIRELIRLHPPMVEMQNDEGNVPLHLIHPESLDAHQILMALIDAAPQTVRATNKLEGIRKQQSIPINLFHYIIIPMSFASKVHGSHVCNEF